jgi:hypothetical protein
MIYAFLQGARKARLQKDLQEEAHGAQVPEPNPQKLEVWPEKIGKYHINQ